MIGTSRRHDAYIVVPPLIKYAAGPLLGPAIIEGAAKESGFDVATLDLNIRYVHHTGMLPPANSGAAEYYGDHCKPGSVLDQVASRFLESVDTPTSRNGGRKEPRTKLWMSHEEVLSAASDLGDTDLGAFVVSELSTLDAPPVLGISLMWEWQVIPSLFISMVVKKAWPQTVVVWGGSHVTALYDKIAKDSRFGTFADGFLPFHSAGSFIQLLEHDGNLGDVDGLIVPGRGMPSLPHPEMSLSVKPSFPPLGQYGHPRLILPIELSTGCPYGRCAFCTYPAIEPSWEELDFGLLDRMLELAVDESAAISFKDSYVLHERLRRIAERIDGRVPWSATTKLHPKLDPGLIGEIARGGCRTVEVGLETIDPESQVLIRKRQPPEWLDQFLEGCSRHHVSAIVNYMTGLPGGQDDGSEELRQLDARLLRLRKERGLMARTEPHQFRLERMSEMARHPDQYGIQVVGEWPWSSVLDWRPAHN